jgi:two-component system, chemotaxis family, sensor kinase Cph1
MMEQFLDFLQNIFTIENWPARWVCGKWSEFDGWLYILSNVAIWAAYFAIPLCIAIYAKKKKTVIAPFSKLLWLFAAFILACGTTHLLDAVMFWHPSYRVAATMLLLTAVVSWITVFKLVKILPAALSLKSPQQLETIIDERTRELEAMNNHLKTMNENIDSFVYSSTHDLKSPVNNLQGLLKIMEMELQNNEIPDPEIIRKMNFSITRIKDSIQKISDVAKFQHHPYQDIEEVEFEALLNDIVAENEEIVKKSNVKIIQNWGVAKITYSKSGLKSILYNLVTNAIKYASPERSPVVILATLEEEGHVVLLISDNGMGMDLESYGDKLFSIFHRFHDHVEGTGIGLYTIKKMVEDKGGTISVESTLDEGSTFKVVLGKA